MPNNLVLALLALMIPFTALVVFAGLRDRDRVSMVGPVIISTLDGEGVACRRVVVHTKQGFLCVHQ